MNAYILRAKPHGKNQENQFLTGRISIGWPCGASLEGKNREELYPLLSKRYSDITATSVSMVNLFVNMPIGSIVLSPSIQDRSHVHIFITESAYKYDSTSDSNEIGNPHFVEARFLKTVTRDSLPKAVVRSLSGARKTLSRISQHYELLDDFISSNFDSETEILSENQDYRSEAISVLYELLSSENESVRLKAATAIIEHTET